MRPETKEEAEQLAAQARQELNGLDVNKLEAPRLSSLELEVLRQLPQSQHKVFELDFYPWRPADRRRVILMRHKNGYEPDDFTCHDAETGRNLGWGDSKDDAIAEAKWKLSDESQGRK